MKWSRRTIGALVCLASVGAGFLFVAVIFAYRTPSAGSPRLEAMTSAVGNAGAAILASAITLIAVVFALRSEERHRVTRDRQERQVALAKQAVDWLTRAVDTLGHIISLQREIVDAVDQGIGEQKQKEAHRIAQEYYDAGQSLRDAELWGRLLDDEALQDALRRADGAIRSWNEQVAGDDSSRQVHLEHGDTLTVFGELSECQRIAEARYVAMARGASNGSEADD